MPAMMPMTFRQMKILTIAYPEPAKSLKMGEGIQSPKNRPARNKQEKLIYLFLKGGMPERCFRDASTMLQGCFNNVSGMLQQCQKNKRTCLQEEEWIN